MNEVYFEKLTQYSFSLLDQLPLVKTIQNLDDTLSGLGKFIMELKPKETEKIRSIWSQHFKSNEKKQSSGLNTIGTLTDRLTVLIIKGWNLQYRKEEQESADNLFMTQTKEIIQALTECQPGYSSLYSKISSLIPKVTVSDWEDVYYQLFCTNLLLWETQEILYDGKIDLLPAEELRAYIRWFSKGNLERNELIHLAEIRFWEKASIQP